MDNIFGGLFESAARARTQKKRPAEAPAPSDAASPPQKKPRSRPSQPAAGARKKPAPKAKQPEVLVHEGEDPEIASEAAQMWEKLMGGKGVPAAAAGAAEAEAEAAGDDAEESGNKLAGGVEVAPPPGDDERKVFVGGITAKRKAIVALFSKFGSVQDVLIPKPKGGQQSSSAFVEFANHLEALKALTMDGQKFNGEVLRVRPVHSKAPKRNREGSTTLYVRNLAFDVTQQALEDLFKDCGKIRRVRIPTFRDSNKPKGCAFVEFTKPESVDKALRKNRTRLNGRQILCEVSLPKPGHEAPSKARDTSAAPAN
eukprot:m51a1_g636 hypothetical protein (313) ;mRNA; f:158575-159687